MQNEESYGHTITAAMNRLGLSNRSAAKLCGISRRHLSTAQKGENISVDVLRKIMTALSIRSVAIGPDVRIDAQEVPPGALPLIAIAANQMERSVALAENAVAILRTISPASDSSSGDNGDLIERASTLIQGFTDHVRSALAAGKPLAPLEEALTATLKESDVSQTPATSNRPRKRKRSA